MRSDNELQRRIKYNIDKPIIKLCFLFFEELLKVKQLAPKDIQHSILDSTLKSAKVLVTQAYRQLLGKDYYKRTLELVEEIKVELYLTLYNKGISMNKCANLERILNDIVSEVSAINNSQNH